MTIRPILATLALTTLTLTGCATATPEEPAAEPTPAGAEQPTEEAAEDTEDNTASSRWAFDYYGGYGEFDLPTEEPSSEWAQNVMDYRAEAGLDDTIYWSTIEADNTNGMDDFHVTGLIFVSDDGQQISSVDWIDDLISEAQDTNDDTDFYNRGVDLLNEDNDPIKPGAKGTIDIAFTETVDPTMIYVVSGLESDLEAYPID